METRHINNMIHNPATAAHNFNELFSLLLYCDETERIEAKEISGDNLGKSFLETDGAPLCRCSGRAMLFD